MQIQTDGRNLTTLRRIWHGLGATRLEEIQANEKAESKRVQAETFANVTETEAAVGRIVGSLCAVTAKNGDAQSAMLASWVSQASFNPPSITVAVAKDRAVESFMLPGGNHLNILKLGNEKETMKALLKGFAPGEDRFGDMKVSYSENNECAIVTDALAYCECAVKSRMECGDHWIALAEVTGGKCSTRKEIGHAPQKNRKELLIITRARGERKRERKRKKESTTNARRTEFNQTRTITSTRARSSKT